jgi:hypothetical protein
VAYYDKARGWACSGARSLRDAPVSRVRLNDKIKAKREHRKQSILNKKVSQGHGVLYVIEMKTSSTDWT